MNADTGRQIVRLQQQSWWLLLVECLNLMRLVVLLLWWRQCSDAVNGQNKLFRNDVRIGGRICGALLARFRIAFCLNSEDNIAYL